MTPSQWEQYVEAYNLFIRYHSVLIMLTNSCCSHACELTGTDEYIVIIIIIINVVNIPSTAQ